VTALLDRGNTVLVAVDGPGGSGKSVLATSLRVMLTGAGVPASVVAMDDFFLPSAGRSRGGASEKPIGGDYDWCRLRDQVLEPLRRGQTARYDRYDWVRDELTDVLEVQPGGVVIVEGVYSSRRELAALYDMRIWVECPRELRLARGLERDGETARSRWVEDWMPSEDRYIQEHRPRELADVIVNGDAG
jgi:uridine kinase